MLALDRGVSVLKAEILMDRKAQCRFALGSTRNTRWDYSRRYPIPIDFIFFRDHRKHKKHDNEKLAKSIDKVASQPRHYCFEKARGETLVIYSCLNFFSNDNWLVMDCFL